MTAISYNPDCLPGYYGETPGVNALIAHCNDNCLFPHLTASQKWAFLSFLTFWQWNCVDAPNQSIAILDSLADFGYELTDEVETLIGILNAHSADDRDAYILINALINQINRSIYAQT